MLNLGSEDESVMHRKHQCDTRLANNCELYMNLPKAKKATEDVNGSCGEELTFVLGDATRLGVTCTLFPFKAVQCSWLDN